MIRTYHIEKLIDSMIDDVDSIKLSTYLKK
jgi:hypothetical protein